MLVDKTHIEWSKDSPRLILCKVLYRIVASKPVLSGMEYVITILEQISPSGKLLTVFYRWIQGSYMLRGYQEGRSCPGIIPAPREQAEATTHELTTCDP